MKTRILVIAGALLLAACNDPTPSDNVPPTDTPVIPDSECPRRDGERPRLCRDVAPTIGLGKGRPRPVEDG